MAAWREAYHRYVAAYAAYASLRGFDSQLNDAAFHRRGFLESWAEPGFHRFWQVWNPGIAFPLYRLYLWLGGRRRRVPATLLVFLVSGFVHALVVWPFVGRLSVMPLITFACFGLLCVLSRWLAPLLRQPRWPWPLNAAVNVGLVLACFDLGFRGERWLCGMF